MKPRREIVQPGCRISGRAGGRLHAARRLAGRWHLVVAHSGAGNLDTTFSLEPEPAADQPLSRLQGDLRVMAEELARQFWGACDALAVPSVPDAADRVSRK